jgi:hypothetical protein
MYRIFVLSPAKASGERARQLLNPNATFDLARRLRSTPGLPLGEIFSFMSGLYFRGKYSYARAFAKAPPGISGTLVITPHRGLLPAETTITLEELQSFGSVPIENDDPRYVTPLRNDCGRLSDTLGSSCEVVFLGSISSKKYVELLLPFFGEHLRFPPDFLGRGDMSRGGLLLRSVAEHQELRYIPLKGAARRGKRPLNAQEKIGTKS